MKFFHLANIFISWGFQVKPHEYQAFEKYTDEMLHRDRVMAIYCGKDLQAIIFYYITKDYLKLYKKSVWEIPTSDDYEGHQIYIDKMLCRKWTKELRQAVKRAFEHKFPHIHEVYYHRAPIDRCVKISIGEGVLCSKV